MTDYSRNVSEGTPIDITVPRECVYQQFEDKPGPRPRCGGPLQESTQTYLIATRRGKRITDSFVASNDMGWFCTHCPTVVINPEQLSDLLQHGLPHWDVGNEFTVLGVIDLDAIPEEKRHLPLGDDDNPIPLVQFTNTSRKTAPGRPARRRRTTPRKRTAPARKKRKKKKRK